MEYWVLPHGREETEFGLVSLFLVCSHYSILPLFHSSESLCLFLPELRINLHQACDDEPRDLRRHDPEEIIRIAKLLLEPTTEHGWYHHPQSHDPRGDGVMDRFVFPLGYHNHEHRVGRKAKAVTELLHGNAEVDQMETVRHDLRGVDKEEIRQMHHTDHDPDAEPEPFFVNGIPAEKPSQHECNDPYRAVDDSYL